MNYDKLTKRFRSGPAVFRYTLIYKASQPLDTGVVVTI